MVMAMFIREVAAAFGRLCVETEARKFGGVSLVQPPSGGCVLKQGKETALLLATTQPPSGGCVLKHFWFLWDF